MDVQAAYQHCQQMASSHYENFPVASVLLPKKLRQPIAAIYAFARQADDFADEGHHDAPQRLALLDGFSAQLQCIARGEAVGDPVFIALADTIQRHRLPISLFEDLLAAFRRDATQKRYANFGELLSYCRCSANPVGRLVLHLTRQASDLDLQQSDQICTALQLINFYQDLTQDYRELHRIYLPQDEMTRFGVDETHFRERKTDDAMRALMQFQYARAHAMMMEGAPLAWRLRGRIGWEIRFTVAGGLRVLQRLQRGTNDVFSRPRLGLRDLGSVFIRTIMPPRSANTFTSSTKPR